MAKKKIRVDQMEHARAARCYFDAKFPVKNEAAELAAFMSIFHPDIKGKRLAAIMSARRNSG